MGKVLYNGVVYDLYEMAPTVMDDMSTRFLTHPNTERLENKIRKTDYRQRARFNYKKR